jgi:putative MATE family efflux protein
MVRESDSLDDTPISITTVFYCFTSKQIPGSELCDRVKFHFTIPRHRIDILLLGIQLRFWPIVTVNDSDKPRHRLHSQLTVNQSIKTKTKNQNPCSHACPRYHDTTINLIMSRQFNHRSCSARPLFLYTAVLVLKCTLYGTSAYQPSILFTKGASSTIHLSSSPLYHSRRHHVQRLPSSAWSMSSTEMNESSLPSSIETVPPSPSASDLSLGASAISTKPSNSIPNRVWSLLPCITKRQQQGRKGRSQAVTPDYEWTNQNLAIALPALLGLLTDPLLSMVDTAFVGRSGPIDLAALGVCTSIFHMAFTIFRASAVATTSLVGGASSPEEKRQIIKISLGFAGVMGSLVLLALRFGGPAFLATMGVSVSSPLYNPACDYLFARCWAAPAVVAIVVSEGAFRGYDDNTTPLVAAFVAAAINLILDPLLMFTLRMGMAGAAWATALSQFGAAALFGWRLWKRRLLPQRADTVKVNVAKVIKSILGANAAMLAKSFSLLVFYTAATALATRFGPVHVATHQVCLSFFWLTTMLLDSGSVSAQLLLSKNMNKPQKAVSLTKYMGKYALFQGLMFSTLVAALGRFVPDIFTTDPTVASFIAQCIPHLAFQQTIVSICLVLEGLAIGGNQFKFTAAGTAMSTAVGLWQMFKATSVIDIWARAVNTFFGMRLIFAILGVVRVHMGLGTMNKMNGSTEQSRFLNPPPPDTADRLPEPAH